MYLITEPCFENITHDYPSALAFYKTNFGKLCERPVQEAGVGSCGSQVWVLTAAGRKEGPREEGQKLVAGTRMRVWLPWKWEENHGLEKQGKETIHQT